MRVQISNDPHTGVERWVENNKLIINEGEKFVRLACEVLRVNADGEEVAARDQVDLTASENSWVDAQGNNVPADSPDADQTSYAYYMYVAENIEAKVNDLRRLAITKADQTGEFNLY